MTAATAYSDAIGTDAEGHLRVEEIEARELAERFGTPLFVISERQIRTNVARWREAFGSRYPRSRILFATKANTNAAVRRIFTLAGAGGDVFGPGELYVTLSAGTDPRLVVLNGFSKRDEELRMAIEAGVTIHLDAPSELDDVARLARELGLRARVGIRTRLLLHALDDLQSDWPPGISAGEGARTMNKFGVGADDVDEMVGRALAADEIEMAGLHHHVGRWAPDRRLHDAVVREQLALAARLRDRHGWVPEYFDFGGGMAFGRAEGHGPLGHDRGLPTCEDYAETITAAFAEELERHDLGSPELFVEPGRALASDIGVLLTRVGVRKRFADTDPEQTWIGVDASQNLLLNTLSGGFYYHPVAVDRPADQEVETVNVGDPLCWFGNLAMSCRLPRLDRGDLLAFLDTGAYCESKSLQFNARPRAGCVLVSGDRAEVITEAESLQDVLRRFRVPARLWAEAVPGHEALSAAP